MIRNKIESITPNPDGTETVAVIVFDDADPGRILSRVTGKLKSHSDEDKAACFDTIKEKLQRCKTREADEVSKKTDLQARLDACLK